MYHSRPLSSRSIWPAAGIESSVLLQHRKSAIHGLPVKSGKSDWLRIRNENSAHAQKIGSGQSSRSLPQARRIVSSGDGNACVCTFSFPEPPFLLVTWSEKRRALVAAIIDARKSRISGNACVILTSISAHTQKLIPSEGRDIPVPSEERNRVYSSE